MLFRPTKFAGRANNGIAANPREDAAVLVGVDRNVDFPMLPAMIHGENNAGVGLMVDVKLRHDENSLSVMK
jgi:hypothetical protein